MLGPRAAIVLACVACLTAAATAQEDKASKTVEGWGEVFDPSRDCKVVPDKDRERLTIYVPGTPHVLSAEVPSLPMNAPRVLRDVQGDFEVRVRVAGRYQPGHHATTHYAPFHGAGLLLWQDRENYVRLERAVGVIKGKVTAYANFEYRAGGRLASSVGISMVNAPAYLRLRREGHEVGAAFSTDGVRWTTIAPVTTKLTDRVKVGVDAVNSAKRLLVADLEGLTISRLSEPGRVAGSPPADEARAHPSDTFGGASKPGEGQDRPPDPAGGDGNPRSGH